MNPFSIASAVITTVSTFGGVARRNTPTLDERVTVEVHGQPGSTKQELYYLALSAANGVTRRSRPIGVTLDPTIIPTSALIQIEYDAADSWVRCTLMYKYGTYGNTAPFDTKAGFYNNLAVYRGPQCDLVGDDMRFVSGELPGIPAGPPLVPILPWAGRVILTGCPTIDSPQIVPAITQNPVPSLPRIIRPKIPSPNPKPPGDNRSRGVVFSEADTVPSTGCCAKRTDLIALVFAALTDPGSQDFTMWDSPVLGPQGE